MSEPGAPHSALGAGAEFDLVRRFWSVLGDRAAPSGDDCAFVEVGGVTLAASSDLSVAGTHFHLGWLQAHEIGFRACAAALSDLAAVAAAPIGVLVSLGVPVDLPEALTTDVMDGLGDAARAAGATVLGGDVVRASVLTLDVTVLGTVARAVRRAGAAPGDELWVTGALGGPRVALRAWEAGREPDRSARERFARPEPRLAIGRWLAEHGATAMIDVSDGLVADAGHLAAASGVAAVLERDRVPVHPAAAPDDALVGGEEYELLVALPPDRGEDAAAACMEVHGVPLTRVGTVTSGTGVRVLEDGVKVESPLGFSHF